ncbi:hypothetical protein ACIP98_04505 [Streptomyces sp. NPDC088354]|uniref:hypothetical protein n=1 Tax=unclassified Streptomyces TaxID=2593676 RepID=UPI0029BF25E1|nr:hypothetical protein [Streptomyces sp. MI02-7b]MDX3070901.1 hypothetical protein [Streptomyces sp. MI02-7b]
MDQLLAQILQAHGGSDRYAQFSELRATIVTGGGLWAIKGVPQDPDPREMTVRLHEEWASVRPYGAPDQRTAFSPGRVAIERSDGTVVTERLDPRASFEGHEFTTPWDALHRAYFNGYALWTYLTTPFLLAMPGVTVTAVADVHENGERWRGLRATFPDGIAGHSREQEFYFGDDLLLRRHDYRVDVAGGFPAAQYLHDYIEAQGLRMPSRRRAYRCGDDGSALPDALMVAIDISDLRYS